MLVRKAFVWSLINMYPHPELTEEERAIDRLIEFAETLFPGYRNDGRMDALAVSRSCIVPVLYTMFPNELTIPEDQVPLEETIEIGEILACPGRWQDTEWRAQLKEVIQGLAQTK